MISITKRAEKIRVSLIGIIGHICGGEIIAADWCGWCGWCGVTRADRISLHVCRPTRIRAFLCWNFVCRSVLLFTHASYLHCSSSRSFTRDWSEILNKCMYICSLLPCQQIITILTINPETTTLTFEYILYYIYQNYEMLYFFKKSFVSDTVILEFSI